jgi:anhydro-N-acetylmuramic acid kinase
VLRVGDLNRVAVRTGVPTIGDFPNGDIAAGGDGAPLVIALFDYALYRDPQRNRVVQNIRGIGNCKLLPASGGLASVIGFDTGPGVMGYRPPGPPLHERRRTLRQGRTQSGARRGRQRPATEAAPGSVHSDGPAEGRGLGELRRAFVRKIVELAAQTQPPADDVIATGTALTVESIALNYETHLHRACTAPTGAIDEVIVGGGGAINPTPLKMLGERLGCRVSTHED